MDAIKLENIPDICKEQIIQLDNENLKNIYSNFNFSYLNLDEYSDHIKKDENLIKKFLYNFLSEYKFIAYTIFDENYNDDFHINSTDYFNNRNSAVICIEKYCLIINEINSELLKEVFKSLKSSLIDVSQNVITDPNSSSTNLKLNESKGESKNFCSHFIEKLKKQDFIQITLPTIGCFLIRRFFYPTNFFKDPSFFKFEKSPETYEENVKRKLKEMFLARDENKMKSTSEKVAQEKVPDNKDESHEIYEFNSNDFILLRSLNVRDNKNFEMVFHIKSQYVFLKENFLNSSSFLREIEFCKNFQHPSIMRCYGFVRSSNSMIKSIIYEFMSNGTLDSHINEVDEMFSIITIYRLYKGIEYLQSNHLIHRDLKPQNILLDHDFIPYISDLETIRTPEEENDEKNTYEFGERTYSSPEQLYGKPVSYPTDIYSFGLLIYYLYEKENMIGNKEFFNDFVDINKVAEIKKMKNGTENIRNIYNLCVKINQDERITIDEIKEKLLDDFTSFSHLDKCFINQVNLGHISIIIEYFYEKISIIKSLNNSEEFDKLKVLIYDHLTLYLNIDSYESRTSSSFHNIGVLYEKGAQNYSKAKEYYELASQYENSESYLSLGDLYYYGRGVNKDKNKAKEFYEKSAQYNNSYAFSYLGELYLYADYHKAKENFELSTDYHKAKEYFELSAKLGNSDGIFNLGYLYHYGLGVKKDYNKAKEYYEKSSEMDNPRALLNLGDLYLDKNSSFYDPTKAIDCYASSANFGNSTSYEKLGNIYCDGIHNFVEKDIDIAKYYYEESSRLGNQNAAIKLNILETTSRNQNCQINNLNQLIQQGKEQLNHLHQMISQIPKKMLIPVQTLVDKNDSADPFAQGMLYYKGIAVPKDYSKALFYFEIAAEQNNPEALLYLGNIYMNGYGVDIDFSKASEYYEKAAEQNNSFSIFQLGELYRIGGYGIEQNYLKAKDYYEKAANQNNFLAFLQLGILYYHGNGVKQDYNQAFKYFELSYKQNHPFGSYYLGLLYFYGHGIKQDYVKAKELFENSEKSGVTECFIFLGYIYSKGYGVEKDYLKAKHYFEKSNNSNGFCELGNLYYNGYGVEKNYEKAREYFELAGNENGDALFNLGLLYLNGLGVEENYQKAREYFELAGDKNDNALFNLGLLYLSGHGVEKSYQKAREYFELAAKQNNPNALFNLGCLYLNGDGVEKDYTKAIEYYEVSAGLGYTKALNNLSILYITNVYGHRNIEKALEYINKSAKLNDPIGTFNLGYVYFDGIGVPKDVPKAIHYFKISADLGNSNAMVNLGCIYYHGLGVKIDYQKAKEYLEQSIKKANHYGYLYLGLLYQYGHGIERNYLEAKRCYELSSYLNNSYAMLCLGVLYEKGLGVEQNYSKAKEHYELSAQKGNLTAFYVLGTFYLNGNIFEIDINKAIQYFMKCCKLEYVCCSNLFMNKFKHHSENELGFIYLSFYDDIDKAYHFYSNAAFSEYPFAQNNFGLLNQFYLNNDGNAQYMFERSSSHKFALADYNLGYLCEINNKKEQSIQHYINASDNEDCPLIFHNHIDSDQRLEISKTFLICYTNLKLVDFYLLKQDSHEESRKYFIKSLAKLKINDDNSPYKFHFVLRRESPKESFEYLESFILNFPFFNLNKETTKHVENDLKQSDETDNNNDEKQKETEIDDEEKSKSLEKSEKKKDEDPDDFEYPNGFRFDIREDNLTFDDPSDLFDFLYQKEELKNIFHSEIKHIIEQMKEIIYTPPYIILFGRINIEKINPKIIDRRVGINELFYEGFDHIELQYDNY